MNPLRTGRDLATRHARVTSVVGVAALALASGGVAFAATRGADGRTVPSAVSRPTAPPAPGPTTTTPTVTTPTTTEPAPLVTVPPTTVPPATVSPTTLPSTTVPVTRPTPGVVVRTPEVGRPCGAR
jgi:hypothetical protein